MPALFSVVVLLPGNTAASFGRLLRSVPRTHVCLAGEHRHPWGWLAAGIHAWNSHLPSFLSLYSCWGTQTLMGFGWLLRFVPRTRACLYLLFSLPFFICGALPGEPRPSMVLLPGNHPWMPLLTLFLPGSPTWITATGFIGLHDDGGPTGCWTSLGISPSTNALGL
ncbi:hypothetical protein K438DRAFT_1822010 [Mycena galopus ATCC 62051]|nr:hypothetical protein K438DRAFT_1822010 [Mycena galopus ATCC 62051]